MSNQASGSGIERVERFFGLGEPQRRSQVVLWLVALPCAVAATFGVVIAFAYASDAGERWFWTAISLNLIIVICVWLGEALYAGALGGRFRRQGRAMWVLANVASAPGTVLLAVAWGYSVANLAGALVGGAMGVFLYSLLFLYTRWLSRTKAREAGDPGPE
jgi:hypothetical protein